MTADPTTYDAIVVGSGISGGWAAKELTEKGLRVLLLERGKQRRAHQGLRQRDEGAVGISASRRTHAARWKRLYPVLKRDYPLNEKNLDLLGDRQGFAVHRGQALRLVSRLSRRRTLAHVGTPELSLERLRLRGERQGRHRDRLADSLCGHRAVVRPRREARRHRRLARRHAAASRRPVPAGDAAQLRRGARRRSRSTKLFDGKRRIIPGRTANLDAGARRAAARASTATPAGSAARTARTSARSRRRCPRRRRRDA